MKKISHRLQKIDRMVGTHYQSIWDCCCDHGFLGLTLLKRQAADTIHFVDIVPSLTTHLESVLQQHFSSDDYLHRWQVHCLDVAKLPLTNQDKQLVIIAGVGGQLLIHFIKEIISHFQQIAPVNSISDIEFMLCPVHYNYQVRQTLIADHCTLIDEYIVTDNKRFYEVIHVKKEFGISADIHRPLNKISPTGDIMWDLSMKSHQQYLAKTINHYQRMLLAKKSDEQIKIKHIIKQYSNLLT
ncbi:MULTISPECIES: tRNA (adenine(22)-N(1))-methyltransferase [unclassified Colwellia]|uniref:tRNA (adenine(22)-N(1))-methyltransferase n=1 Tax=unclassified Colwellia TaxID=196834 RepID=UPI0015F5797F|nr:MULTISPECIES: tRNA (adenine(22)-N(1))-methyltransferase TrmK [unclassified Colwellia]MBA6230952.1 tRNA (adenine(22)-N(1))-methyltransferase TrmK [Colwellia sp. MB02u-7]MBA6234883.1 tRNA (adenine(22)-N(1))-methyltransferase TrmK [Colwellia sp. MB02u-11]MBA6301438.1 tRNA (adenine(22)-N(1))-methyltransferase TrmK [Colwellia sp. MB3u-22]MBA6312827.1 tRNA (adenine(22)-N(1))-methyltransferase TrmK [Colwellia sp. MB3u-64]